MKHCAKETYYHLNSVVHVETKPTYTNTNQYDNITQSIFLDGANKFR